MYDYMEMEHYKIKYEARQEYPPNWAIDKDGYSCRCPECNSWTLLIENMDTPQCIFCDMGLKE